MQKLLQFMRIRSNMKGKRSRVRPIVNHPRSLGSRKLQHRTFNRTHIRLPLGVPAFGSAEELTDIADRLPEWVERFWLRRPLMRLELGEGHFDGVDIWTVGAA